MCGIAGFYQSHFDYLTEEDHYRQILEDMEKVQKHRGPDEQGKLSGLSFWVSPCETVGAGSVFRPSANP